MMYAFLIRGEISPRRAAWFEGLSMVPVPGGYTLLAGPVADQPALHGILDRIRDLGLPLAACTELRDDPAGQ
ncbi:MAG TPA: hypothetical protein VNT75_33525 [Symbiobacteriaceae bacterium]|nr:hypothetical protein [Symbiobacteriaceae bacterium]